MAETEPSILLIHSTEPLCQMVAAIASEELKIMILQSCRAAIRKSHPSSTMGATNGFGRHRDSIDCFCHIMALDEGLDCVSTLSLL